MADQWVYDVSPEELKKKYGLTDADFSVEEKDMFRKHRIRITNPAAAERYNKAVKGYEDNPEAGSLEDLSVANQESLDKDIADGEITKDEARKRQKNITGMTSDELPEGWRDSKIGKIAAKNDAAAKTAYDKIDMTYEQKIEDRNRQQIDVAKAQIGMFEAKKKKKTQGVAKPVEDQRAAMRGFLGGL